MSESESRYQYVSDETDRAMIDLAIDFIDSEVVGRIDIQSSRSMLATPGLIRIIVERERMVDVTLETTEPDGEGVVPFSTEYMASQLDLSKVRVTSSKSKGPSLTEIEDE